jgi:hypothetical protein
VRQLLFIALLALAACRDERPPQPTAEQSDQLNEAEDMLNDMAQNEEGPDANASGPSNSSDSTVLSPCPLPQGERIEG